MASFKEKHIWRLLEAYARKNSLVINQIQSFDDFINFGIQEIINQESKIELPNYTVQFGQVTVDPPRVIEEDRSLELTWPNDARMRDLSYDAAILCDITETYVNDDETQVIEHRRLVIGRIPIMLRSASCNLSKISEQEAIEKGECPNDPGGYFIIKGNERVLVAQMRSVYNQVFVLRQKSGEKYKWVAETRSMSDETGHSVLLRAMIGNDDRTIEFSLPYIKEPIPVGVVFKALGYSDEDMVNLIGLGDNVKTNKYIHFIKRDSFFCSSQKEALEHISKFAMHVITEQKEREYAWQVIETEMLPHLGITGSIAGQACFLGFMVRHLIRTHIVERLEDDRDNYANKRVDTAGTLFYDIFRNIFKKYVQSIKAFLEKRQRPEIKSFISKSRLITKSLHQCISSGNWGVQKNASYVRAGVSQILDRMTYAATMSHLRRVVIPTGKEGKNMAMRQIHGSSFGFVCPCECFHPETKIATWQGGIKLAKDIVVGDLLIDDKGNLTRVKSTCFGRKGMYMIKHSKKEFEDYTVTDNHILTLKSTEHKKIYQTNNFQVILLDKENLCYRNESFPTKEEALAYISTVKEDGVLDVEVEKYLQLSSYMKNTLKTFKGACVNWPEKPVNIDPYILGMRLGNESSIPREYLVNSKKVRMQVLAGLIDAVGHVCNGKIAFQGLQIVEDVMILARSLGFCCEKSTELTISGSGMEEIPTRLKILPSSDDSTLQSSFVLVKQEEQPFVGWQLEGNGRFLLGDFTVTHNTPEGQKIGVVLNLALLTKITKKIPKVQVKSVLETCRSITSVEDINFADIKDCATVVLNGAIIGFSTDPETTVEEIRRKRNQGLLSKEVSISYDIVDNDIRIFCDEGRFTRPLLTLTENRLNITGEKTYKWNSLLRSGIVQYVDAAEIENSIIAMTHDDLKIQHNDFCEIHPCTMLGVMAAMIPWSDHSQSPRNCYQSSMGKQALGLPLLSYNLRADTLLHVLYYPQRPIVCTKAAEIFKFNDMPSGINAIVAVMCYTG